MSDDPPLPRNLPAMDAAELAALVTIKMPFGRYKDRVLIDLPEPYLVWFHRQGFPRTKLGQQLALLHEIKVNGLENLVRQAVHQIPGSGRPRSD